MLRCLPPPSLLFSCPAAYMSAHANQCPVSDGPHCRRHTHTHTPAYQFRIQAFPFFFSVENVVSTVIVSECCGDWHQRWQWNAPIRDHCEIMPSRSLSLRIPGEDVSFGTCRFGVFEIGCLVCVFTCQGRTVFFLFYYFPCQHYWFVYVLMGIIWGLLLLFWKDKCCCWWLFTVYIFQLCWGWGIFAVAFTPLSGKLQMEGRKWNAERQAAMPW